MIKDKAWWKSFIKTISWCISGILLVLAVGAAFVKWPMIMCLTAIVLVVSCLIIGFAVTEADEAKDRASKREQRREVKKKYEEAREKYRKERSQISRSTQDEIT